MPKKYVLLIICLLTVFIFTGCSSGKQLGNTTSSDVSGKIKVSVSFNAMKEFVEAVGKDKVEISTIIPDGTEPHDFEPTAKDMVSLSNAAVFVYNGCNMERWADDVISTVGNSNLISVNASDGISYISNTDAEEVSEHGQYDPHVWLSLKNAEIEVKNITNALVKADSSDERYFRKNCDEYIEQLENLYNEYYKKFQSVKNKNFVTGHAAFAYLCRDFGLTQNSVEDVFAEGEPSAKKLAELVEYCKENNVKTIFVEDMVSKDVSETLANQVGATVETIYTIESSEDNLSYIDRMKANLKRIYDSLL